MTPVPILPRACDPFPTMRLVASGLSVQLVKFGMFSVASVGVVHIGEALEVTSPQFVGFSPLCDAAFQSLISCILESWP